MQFDEKVLTALEVLTDAAENDFELYRICTLVRDLIAPPVAEQIDAEHQVFNGVSFRKKKDFHYKKTLGIQQVIWQYYNGEIPECDAKYEVHHDDWNPENNAPTNLILLTKSEHALKHGSPFVTTKCVICGKEFTRRAARMTTTCSVECGSKLRSKNQRKLFTCPVCGKTLEVIKSDRRVYCSHSCASKQAASEHRDSHYETRTCPICGKIFETKLSEDKKTCSRKCGGAWRRQHRKSIPKTCPNCGKNFNGTSRQIYCSNKCCAQARKFKKHN